ncbi:branched-chain amino acid ABC transporter permease [uncultured Paracoccus sp.]|uniref:branched-chain amino acid ABC transporter permease n=1 Tax=uncultured Paracoccus sp. TaxID=189685 RepID=UPI002635CBBB|nr:branched-chain amino acid ABC transporter permease [uncultured Paracoccus sp.]
MTRLLPALLVLAIAAVPWLMPNLQVLLTLALAKGIAVMGVTVLLRAGQVSFGHALFFAVSAYAAAFLIAAWPGADLILVLVAGVAGALVAGLLVGLFVVRYRGIFFSMLNLAFSMIFWSFLEKFYHLTGGADGKRIRRPPVLGADIGRSDFELLLFYITLGLALALAWFTLRWLGSPRGHLFRTIKTNETRLQYLGMSPRHVMLSGYVLSAVLCGVGGVLMGLSQGVVTPDFAWWVRSGEMVFIAVLGGAGSVAGALLGAIVYEMVRIYASAFAGDIWQMLLGGFLLIIILFAPGGLVGMFHRFFPGRAQDGEDRT